MLCLEAVAARVPRPVSGGGDNRFECASLAERLRLSPRLLEGEVLVGVARHEEHLIRVRLRVRVRVRVRVRLRVRVRVRVRLRHRLRLRAPWRG